MAFEKFATRGERVTLVLEALPGNKVKVSCQSWEKTILRDEVLEVRAIEDRLRIARKDRDYDQDDPKVEPYDPYGPGTFEDNTASA